MKAELRADRNFVIGEVDDHIFSGFVEHIGRSVYNGIYEPGHPEADADGFRRDVAALVRELNMPLTRYPGGNFASGYNWKDGVGPVEQRPVRPEYAWQAVEPNLVGIDEFVRWCRLAGTEPLYTVNLCTNTPKAAQELVEYCNCPGGTWWSDFRRRNGAEAPHNIRRWCLGNEVDGEWQIGHMTAMEYGRVAHEAAKMMRMADPDIELCACGSTNNLMPTFGSWDLEVLRHVFDDVDYLSVHRYFDNGGRDFGRFFSMPELMDWYLEHVVACCDAIAAERRSRKKLMIALDEWNVMYRSSAAPAPEDRWHYGRPLLEEVYDMADVLVDGGVMLSMLDHADRLKIACLAQSVNVIAPIMTRPGGGVWRQTIFYPFRETSRYGRGTALRSVIESPAYQSAEPCVGSVPYLRAAVVRRRDAEELTVFAINRAEEEMEFTAALEGFSLAGVAEAEEIHHDSLDAVNTENEENVAPRPIAPERFRLAGNRLSARLKPYSWNLFRLTLAE